LVVLDEAQKVTNIGLTLKLLVDSYPELQVIATGSSSFELANKVLEPLTGRNTTLQLFPLSLGEIKDHFGSQEANRRLNSILIYGSYPEIIKLNGAEREERLLALAADYLYKDVFIFEKLRSSEILVKLLRALALQIGNEVSYNELSQTVGADKNTVSKYIQILERAFVVFRLSPYSNNARNELKKLRKIYFYDLGLRNAIIKNFNPPELRNDIGALWENLMIVERLKSNQIEGNRVNTFFWRNHERQEVDYLEEQGGKISAFEFKWTKQGVRAPVSFKSLYPKATFKEVNRENFWESI